MSALKTYAKTIALAALWALTLALLVLSLGWIPPARAEAIDGVIESDPGARALHDRASHLGPGELRAEIELEAWCAPRADTGLVMRRPEGLWEELVRRCERCATRSERMVSSHGCCARCGPSTPKPNILARRPTLPTWSGVYGCWKRTRSVRNS